MDRTEKNTIRRARERTLGRRRNDRARAVANKGVQSTLRRRHKRHAREFELKFAGAARPRQARGKAAHGKAAHGKTARGKAAHGKAARGKTRGHLAVDARRPAQ